MSRSPHKTLARRERRLPLPEPEKVPKDGKASRGRTTASATPLTIRAHGIVVDNATRNFARKHAGFKFAKFALYVERITLHVDNVRSTPGTPAINCRTVIAASRIEPVVAEAGSTDQRDAIEQSLERGERALRRALARRNNRVAQARRGTAA